jgi:hypothetical protein
MEKCGFVLKNQLNWPNECWWDDFYEPLERKITEIKHGNEKADLFKNIKALEAELGMVKKNPKKFNCAHYILQKSK